MRDNINIRKKCGGRMLKSTKAKISVLLVGFLVLCGTAIVAVKSFASSNNSEILTFRIDPSEYTAWSSVDDANVGEKLATIGIHLNEEGDKHYYLSENTYTAPATISPAVLHDMSAIISSGEYDGTPQYPTIANVAGMSESGEVYLEENVDFVVTYLEDNPYVGDYFVEVGDYQITVSPLQGSNYTFEPFEMTFTVHPKRLTVTDAIVENKYYNNSNSAVVSSVQFDGAELQYGHDYEAYALLESSDVGTWRAQLEIIVYNARYCFYDEQNPDTYPLQTYYEVDGVEILPRELTEDRTNVQVLYEYYDYTGEENKPPLEVSTMYPYDSGEEDFHPLYLDDAYTVVYPEDTINAGVKYLTVKGINNFSGSITVEYTIEPALVHDLEISTSEQTYTGEALEPEPVVTANFYGDRITLSTNDYDILHQEEFVDAGSYTFTVQDSDGSNYRFSDTDATFTIIPYEISSSDISLSENVYKYNGTSQTPSATVTVGNTTINANDYDVEFSADTIGNDESDTIVTVTVRAKNNTNISGEATTTYTITPREVLTISGIEDNQQITYNGSPVVLEGNIMVEENPGGIKAEDLTVQWYASDGVTVIERPTNAGSYKAVYSYEDSDYRGALAVNFEITKAASPSPAEAETDFKIAAGQTLAELGGERTVGFNWTNSDTVVTQGNNVYTATYTYNGDTENYETLSLTIPVYGLAHVHINATESEGGEINVSSQEVLEEETITITIAPERGQILSSITVNGVDYTNSVDNNTLSIVAGTDDIEIVATFAQLRYDVIEGAEQVIDLDKDDTAIFRIDASYELFVGGAVYVDDALVNAENYTSWDGSTYVQLTDNYLNTLSVGEHTLTIAFNDSGVATTTFTILKADDSGNDEGGSDSINDDENKDNKNAIAPNSGFVTAAGGSATAAVGLLTTILIVCAIVHKTRR